MSSLAAKPLVAVSLLVPSLILLGYLWQRRRAEEAKAIKESTNAPINCLDSKEVSLKLENLNRSRLDCIEEEDNSAPASGSPCCDLTSAVEAIKVIELKKEVITSDSKISTEEPQPLLTSQEVKEVAAQEFLGETAYNADNTSIAEQTSTDSNLIMTEKDLAEVDSANVEESVPDVNLALKDPLCNSNPTSPTATTKIISSTELSSSPVKSETSDSQKSYESWSDLIEQDEREELSRSMNENLKLDGECGRHDSGVVSPSEEFSGNEPGRKGRAEVLRRSSGDDAGIGGSETGEFSDSGHSSEVYCEDSQIMAYHFYVQDYLCGSFIGVNGSHIKKLKSECNCNVILKNDRQKSSQKRRLRGRERKYGDGSLNLCIIEGTRTNIDKCLDMIRDKFYDNPELTLEQINKPDANLSLYNGSVTLSLAEGIMHDVCVSSIVNGGHIFVQQPGHPTFSALERLDNCMYNTYTQLTTPELSRPILQNSICVVNSSEGWYRCQVVGYHEEEDVCDIKYIDYGGYDNVPADSLRQIRTDFLSLPFQAIECYLANIVPTEEDTVTASVLEELVAGQVVQARMIGMNEDGIPMVHLYRALGGQTVMVNRELVDRSCANWIEATIVPLVSTAEVDNWNILGDSSLEGLPCHIMQIKYLIEPAVEPYTSGLSAEVGHTGIPSPSPDIFTPPPPAETCPLLACSSTMDVDDYAKAFPPLSDITESGDNLCTAFSNSFDCQLQVESSDDRFNKTQLVQAELIDFDNLSPGLFLRPYSPFNVGENPSTTYLNWSRSDN